MRTIKPMKGKRFGSWLVLDQPPIIVANQYKWLCRCECGLERYVHGGSLRNGHSKSCITCSTVPYLPWYPQWASIRARCYNKDYRDFPKYGGRGIKMSEEFKNFETFSQWIRNLWKPGLAIHRIDNNADYSEDNCILLNKIEHIIMHNKTRGD